MIPSPVLPPVRPGDVLALKDNDYLFGTGDLLLRVVTVHEIRCMKFAGPGRSRGSSSAGSSFDATATAAGTATSWCTRKRCASGAASPHDRWLPRTNTSTVDVRCRWSRLALRHRAEAANRSAQGRPAHAHGADGAPTCPRRSRPRPAHTIAAVPPVRRLDAAGRHPVPRLRQAGPRAASRAPTAPRAVRQAARTP
jgi:hypothetical protein